MSDDRDIASAIIRIDDGIRKIEQIYMGRLDGILPEVLLGFDWVTLAVAHERIGNLLRRNPYYRESRK